MEILDHGPGKGFTSVGHVFPSLGFDDDIVDEVVTPLVEVESRVVMS